MKTMRGKFEKLWNQQKLIICLVTFSLSTQVVSILHRPNPRISGTNEPLCNYYITKLKIFNIHIDCDSQYFLLESQSPSRLLDPNLSILQDRPIFVLIAYLIARIISSIGIPEGAITYLGNDNIPQTYHVLNYAIFVFLNALVLIIAILLCLKVLLRNQELVNTKSLTVALVSSLFVAQNPINREYFWTPTSQIFNLAVPTLLFALSQNYFKINRRNVKWYLLAFSTLSLIYPVFLVVIPILVFTIARNIGKNWAPLGFIPLVPKLILPIVYQVLGSDYVDRPISGTRKLIWVVDSIQKGTFLVDTWNNLLDFLTSLPATWSIITFLLVLLWRPWNYLPKEGPQIFKLDSLNSLIVVFSYLIGLFLIGQYGQRFTLGLITLLGLLVLNSVNKRRQLTKIEMTLLILIVFVNCVEWFSN